MRVVIIGATGHVGTWLVPRLVRDGHQVTAVSRGARAPYHASPEWRSVRSVTLDRDAGERDGSFGESIASLKPEAVIDLICFNEDSALHLVNALRGRVELFLHCGTLWVHGVPATRPYDETARREPFGEYGIRKASIEKLLLEEATNGFPAGIIHPGHITGPGWMPINPAGHLDPSVFDALSRGDLVSLPEDGLSTLQHVHADDVAQSFALAVASPERAIGEAFHIAAREPVTLVDYAREVASWSGCEANLGFLPWSEWEPCETELNRMLTRDHMLHSPHASIAKAEAVLGFAPRYTAVEAVRDAIGHRFVTT